VRRPPLLPRSFYARDALDVARDVLGALIRRGDVVLRITEVEAYRWPGDTACHGRHGRTERNAALWGPPGTAYVYLCYGLHHMLNLVTGKRGEAQAVLVRACEPVAGLATVRRRRGGLDGPALLAGPGRVGAALGLDLSFDGRRLYEPGILEIRRGASPSAILAGPRIGIAYALPPHRRAPWRLAAAGTPWVSRPGGLRPAPPCTRATAAG
jgi:DNA-3-methyladenine glycosylase